MLKSSIYDTINGDTVIVTENISDKDIYDLKITYGKDSKTNTTVYTYIPKGEKHYQTLSVYENLPELKDIKYEIDKRYLVNMKKASLRYKVSDIKVSDDRNSIKGKMVLKNLEKERVIVTGSVLIKDKNGEIINADSISEWMRENKEKEVTLYGASGKENLPDYESYEVHIRGFYYK